MIGAALPIEVIERVIDFVHELPYDLDGVVVKRYAIWKACALACRAMTPRSQYWLFEEVSLKTQSHAESFIHALRRKPTITHHTRRLTIVGPPEKETGQKQSWISWIPLLLAPQMTNLKALSLEGDVFLGSHPSFSMALTAFKSIRELNLYQVQFSTFGHCARLIQAFPRLTHLSFEFLSWKRPFPDSPHPQSSPSSRRRISHITHLDLLSERADGSDVEVFTKWFIRVQETHALRTLSLFVQSNDWVQDVLRCGPFVRSVYLMLGDDSPLYGVEDLAHLQTLHFWFFDHTFPLQFVTSIILSTSSSHIRSLTIYIKTKEECVEDPKDKQQPDDLNVYRTLDDALCSRILKGFHFTLCIYNTTSEKVVPQWRKQLRAFLPKFFVNERLQVESTPGYPNLKWAVNRDGF